MFRSKIITVLLCALALGAGIFACGSSDDPAPPGPADLRTPYDIVADVINSTTVNLSWIDNSVGETDYIVDHQICYSLAGASCPCYPIDSTGLPPNSTAYSYTDLSPLMYNLVRISAYDADLYSEMGDAVVFYTPMAAPVITSATGDASSVTVNWSHTFLTCHIPTDNEGHLLYESSTAPDSGYALIYDTTASGDNSPSVSHAFTPACSSGQTCYYKVRVIDAIAYSTPYSDVATVEMP